MGYFSIALVAVDSEFSIPRDAFDCLDSIGIFAVGTARWEKTIRRTNKNNEGRMVQVVSILEAAASPGSVQSAAWWCVVSDLSAFFGLVMGWIDRFFGLVMGSIDR